MSTWAAPLTIDSLLRDELSMPSKQRIRRDECPSEGFGIMPASHSLRLVAKAAWDDVMANKFLDAHWPQRGLLTSRDADEVRRWLRTLLNGELGLVSAERHIGEEQGGTINEFVERVASSDAFEDIRRDEVVSLPELDLLMVGCVLAIKEHVRFETRSEPAVQDDRLSPGIPMHILIRIEYRLRATAESLRSGVFEEENLGLDMTDEVGALRLHAMADKVVARIRYREGREAIRGARLGGGSGAPLRPDTILAAAVDQALAGRRAAVRYTVASLLIRDVLGAQITPEQIRARLNDFYRRNPRK